jgi:hypothetical protein
VLAAGAFSLAHVSCSWLIQSLLTRYFDFLFSPPSLATLLVLAAMNEYRAFIVDQNGHVLAPSRIIYADDDKTALKKTREYSVGEDQNIELWLGSRRVAVIARSNADHD